MGQCNGKRAAKYPRFNKPEWKKRKEAHTDLQGSVVTTNKVAETGKKVKGNFATEGSEWIFIKPDHPRLGKKFADIVLKQKTAYYYRVHTLVADPVKKLVEEIAPT